ncbi:MAG: lamin tail domain-containing protein, partial [Dehalococcoidia bacterium]|nr:lamin tail domain-containing protein [Dehalococcoidia bacterium]
IAPDATPEAAHEWVEIRNGSRDPVSVANCAVSDGAAATRLPAVTLPANGRLVLAATRRFLDRYPSYDALVAIAPTGRVGNGLRNEGGVVAIVCHGAVIDALSYGDDASVFDPPLPRPVTGGFARRAVSTPATAADFAPLPASAFNGFRALTTHVPIALVRR